jgi:hypothetical protein
LSGVLRALRAALPAGVRVGSVTSSRARRQWSRSSRCARARGVRGARRGVPVQREPRNV